MSDKLRAIALPRFKEAFTLAVDLIDLDGAELDEQLVPLWRDALHAILVEYGSCPCAGVHEGACFLTWTRSDQRTRFPRDHSLGYDMFLQTFQGGRATALIAIASMTHESTH